MRHPALKNLRYALALGSFMLAGCGANFLSSGDGSGSGGFKGGTGEEKNGGGTGTGTSNATGVDADAKTNPEGWEGLRQDVAVDYGSDSQDLYVPAKIVYNGQDAGDDALFKFFIQRISPAPERQMRLMAEARGYHESDAKTLNKVCRCGQKSTFWFFWEHKSLRRGGLHSKTYDADNRLQGDWILDHSVSLNRWRSRDLKDIPEGKASIFLGADTENPSALLGVNKTGNGYLRTWYYHPNSLSTTEHRWDSRDDMRIGMTCEVSKCPADLRAATEIDVLHHYSHESSWLKP